MPSIIHRTPHLRETGVVRPGCGLEVMRNSEVALRNSDKEPASFSAKKVAKSCKRLLEYGLVAFRGELALSLAGAWDIGA